jgi:hypothetical protein
LEPAELASAPRGSADLVIAHSVLPGRRRDEQLAFLEGARDAVGEEGLVAATAQGELVRPYLGSGELDADGIADGNAGEGGTLQTKQYALDTYSSALQIVDFVVGGVGNLYDLVLLQRL